VVQFVLRESGEKGSVHNRVVGNLAGEINLLEYNFLVVVWVMTPTIWIMNTAGGG